VPPVMAAVGATMMIRSPEAERSIPAAEFFQGVYVTAVAPGELLTKVTVPALSPGEGDGWASATLGREGTGIVSVAATVADGTARIAVGCVAAVPVVVMAAADEVEVRNAVRSAGLDPPSDVHASAAYRCHLAETLAVRAVTQALEQMA